MANTPQLHFRLVTPTGTVVDEHVDHVIVPTASGQITILPNHTSLISVLQPGELTISVKGKERQLVVAGGVVEIHDSALVVLADTAEFPADIDLQDAQKEAKRLAKELAVEAKLDLNTYEQLRSHLARQQARIAVAKRWRR